MTIECVACTVEMEVKEEPVHLEDKMCDSCLERFQRHMESLKEED